jgi:outer membrane receptor for ferrienterochelin and colicins
MAQAWSNELPAERAMLRSPDWYAYLNANITPIRQLEINLSSVYTGPMWVPHFGGAPGVEHDVLMRSKTYAEVNVRVATPIKLIRHFTLEPYVGVLNMFNAYQQDFDLGKYRDSNYIYGPSKPRTYCLGFLLH